MKERTAEIEKLLKQKDEFVNQLGHDLKSPLNPLLNLLPIIEDKLNDADSKEMFVVINRNMNYMKNLVTKTLQLARLNAPGATLSIENINLADEINNVISKNKLMFKEYNIWIENRVDEAVLIKGDALKIEELFENLIGNSVKYSPNGGTITIDVKDDDDFVIVSIADEGIGMTKEQISHIFDEFYKVDSSKHDFDSSGLGMAICKRIVEMHGGRIWAESLGLGKGTTVFFTLPLVSKNKIIAKAEMNE